MMNDPAENKLIADKLRELQARADQQPVSYIQLFREAMDISEDQFKRAMAAEARMNAMQDARFTEMWQVRDYVRGIFSGASVERALASVFGEVADTAPLKSVQTERKDG